MRFAALLSRTRDAAWQGHLVKAKPLRASGVRRQLRKLLEDPDAVLDDREGDAAHTFVSAVQVANPGMSFVEALNRAIYHVMEHPKTRLPNRGLTGCPAFSTSPSSAVSLCVGGSAAGRSSGPRDGRALGAVIPQAFDSAAMETV